MQCRYIMVSYKIGRYSEKKIFGFLGDMLCKEYDLGGEKNPPPSFCFYSDNLCILSFGQDIANWFRLCKEYAYDMLPSRK